MSERLQLAKAYEAALFAGRMDEVGRCMTDDVIYWVAGRQPIGGEWKGRDAVLHAFEHREFGLGAADWAYEDLERIWYEADERVIVEIRERSWLRSAPDDALDQRTCVVIRFRDGPSRRCGTTRTRRRTRGSSLGTAPSCPSTRADHLVSSGAVSLSSTGVFAFTTTSFLAVSDATTAPPAAPMTPPITAPLVLPVITLPTTAPPAAPTPTLAASSPRHAPAAELVGHAADRRLQHPGAALDRDRIRPDLQYALSPATTRLHLCDGEAHRGARGNEDGAVAGGDALHHPALDLLARDIDARMDRVLEGGVDHRSGGEDPGRGGRSGRVAVGGGRGVGLVR